MNRNITPPEQKQVDNALTYFEIKTIISRQINQVKIEQELIVFSKFVCYLYTLDAINDNVVSEKIYLSYSLCIIEICEIIPKKKETF